MSQLLGTTMGVAIAFVGGYIIYASLKKLIGIRLEPEEEFDGADLAIHKISSTAERETSW